MASIERIDDDYNLDINEPFDDSQYNNLGSYSRAL